jgi:hypothetical protein
MTVVNPDTVTHFVGSIYFIAKDGNEHKVRGSTYTCLSEAFAIDTTPDGSAGGPEFPIPIGSVWTKLPHYQHGTTVWERTS